MRASVGRSLCLGSAPGLIKSGGIDSHELTNPELVVSDLANPELDFYKPWDIDGDGKKQEFIVRTYASCNGDRFSFLKVNKDKNRIENIEVIHEDGSRGKYLFVDFNKDSFKVEDGIIKIKYYDNTQGEFFESWYKYDEKEQVLKLVEG